jgi:uncharacterized membrane protein YhaH (DUF805 family)
MMLPSSTHAGNLVDLINDFTRGRVGRARYLVLGFASNLLLFAGLVLLAEWGLTPLLELLFGAAALALGMLLGARRLNDLGRSGWGALGLLVPMLNLVFFFYLLLARGERGDNRYGPQPAPNPRGLVWMAWAIPALVLAGMLAAWTLAPHKSNAERAREGMEQAA